MELKWDNVLTAALVICALVTTGAVVYRSFFAPLSPPMQSATEEPRFVEDWTSQLASGMRFGPSGAPVQLVEFGDYECPYCATFHATLKALRERYPTQVALTYIHLPLASHRFAVPAARVAECAGEQGRFAAMHDSLFDGQKSFGLKPWSDYATEAGVPDAAAFQTCLENTASVARVEAGKQLASKLDIKATPTLIVNGWRLAHPPSLEELDGMVKAVLAGKRPVSDG